MREVRHQRITAPDASGHGLGISDGQPWLVEDCVIDLSACPLEGLDEAVGITWGSRALFRRCVIRGAGKLLLCGSGDADKLAVERGKTVIFEDCLLEDFGRRGPEVQSCMRVILRRCLIRNWGEPGRFAVRAFAAWAHHGGRIEAYACVFDQPRFWRGWRLMARDWLAHLGQAWNDEGLRGLLRPAGWLPGVCRGADRHGGRARPGRGLPRHPLVDTAGRTPRPAHASGRRRRAGENAGSHAQGVRRHGPTKGRLKEAGARQRPRRRSVGAPHHGPTSGKGPLAEYPPDMLLTSEHTVAGHL